MSGSTCNCFGAEQKSVINFLIPSYTVYRQHMEVFILQTVTIKKSMIIKHIAFVLILAAAFGVVAVSRGMQAQTQEVKLYFVDAEMLRLIPISTTIPKTSTQKMAQYVVDELIEGRNDNPKIRRLIPKEKRCMTVKVKDTIAYVDIKKSMVEGQPEGRDLEMLTVYSIVNSLTGLDGIVNVRFTIDGKTQKDFKGYLDMRETFIPDYFI